VCERKGERDIVIEMIIRQTEGRPTFKKGDTETETESVSEKGRERERKR
jgi:hypothetical protein